MTVQVHATRDGRAITIKRFVELLTDAEPWRRSSRLSADIVIDPYSWPYLQLMTSEHVAAPRQHVQAQLQVGSRLTHL